MAEGAGRVYRWIFAGHICSYQENIQGDGRVWRAKSAGQIKLPGQGFILAKPGPAQGKTCRQVGAVLGGIVLDPISE